MPDDQRCISELTIAATVIVPQVRRRAWRLPDA